MRPANVKITKLGIAAASLALIATLGLSGCTANSNTPDPGDHQHGIMSNSKTLTSSDRTVAMFAQMMIPHHQQAVDMGTLAETRASSESVKKIAAQIKAEQEPEIKLMQGWIDSFDLVQPMGGMMANMDQVGYLSDEQMKALESAKGEKFDALYIKGMISHHEGAISMAKYVLKVKDAGLRKLAKTIIDSQTKQIAYLKSLQ